ncbi:MAG TPA: ABC transporter ATP-binding protein [Saccharofermentans sp.]|jgi:ATP-binding cassette, subfamily B, multidrug efflux pump|nr:ABC transporter ATP-binding protein [Clostridia bacterium]NLX68011.1 ABC transporter ATP-binding protein [Clostridiaceae bacterium]HOO48366.1 ABC transporter ATP-binding protein [Saccharofermentans sp.]HPQ31931.1 ABC transporter ATP-binding protein [Saccharofermentans sp.]HRV50228.1 ABC transporter ATP-binding protein [Saccharofermentans sp.]
MRFLLSYILKYKKQAFLSPFLKLIEAAFELLVPLVISYLIDKGLNGLNGLDNGILNRTIVLLVVFALTGYVVALFAQYYASDCASLVASSIRQDLYLKVSRLSASQIEKIGTSAITTALTGDINQISTGVNLTLRLLLRSPMIVFGATIMAIIIDPSLSWIFILLTIVLISIVFFVMRHSVPFFESSRKALDLLVTKTITFLSGVRVIRSYNRTKDEFDRFNDLSNQMKKKSILASNASALINPLTFLAVNLSIIALIMFGAIRVEDSYLSLGSVVALYNLLSQILVELIKLANLIVSVSRALACANRVQSIIQTDVDDSNIKTLSLSNETASVVFDDVSFKYEGSSSPTIENLSFEIKAGETIGITGMTGSGKSTIAYLLAGLYPCSSGEIRISAKDINFINSESLHNLVSLCYQKTKLITNTIESNIKFFRDSITMDQVEEASRVSCCKDFIEHKSKKYETNLYASGAGLSGGQRQRLGIARALANCPKLLILDDSMASLDAITESKVLNNISTLEYKPTVVIVSQKLRTLRQCDKILLIDEGKLQAFGPHDELVKTSDQYKSLWKLQGNKEEMQ